MEATFGKRPRPRGSVTIYFMDDDMEQVPRSHEDAFLVITKIKFFDMKRILVNSKISTNVLFLDTLLAIGKTKQHLKNVDFPLIGFM